MSFASMNQLRTRSWPTQAEAVKDLKRNGFKPRGTDYELREVKPGSWQIADITGDDAPPKIIEPADKPVHDPKALARGAKALAKAIDPKGVLGKKAAVEPKKAGNKHPADARADDKIAKASEFNVHFRISPSKKIDRPAATSHEAVAIALQLNAEHGSKGGRKALIYALIDGVGHPVSYDPKQSPPAEPPPITGKELAKAAKEATAAEPPAVETPKPPADADLTTLPAEGGPYTVRIEAEHLRQVGLLHHALDISRQIRSPVTIIGADGKTARAISYESYKGWKKSAQKAAPRASSNGGGRPRGGDSKQSRGIALLIREQGATAAELRTATGWPIGQRHINKLARLSGKEAKSLGKDRWQLA